MRKSESPGRTLVPDCAITADIPGIWVAPYLSETVGMRMSRGRPLGQVVNDESFYFSSVVSQKEVSRVFSGEVRSADVRVAGQAGSTIRSPRITQIPMEQTALPSAALGLGAGGDVAVSFTDSSGMRAAETFYEVRLELPAKSLAAPVGMVRVTVPGMSIPETETE